jgi:peroxiredoxin
MKILLTAFTFLLFSFVATAQMDVMKPEGLKVGDMAPDFTATNQANKSVELKNLLTKGDVVVIFYRGQWCPYCNKQLSKINDSLSMITAKGATVVAITPETAENVAKTITKTKATFDVLEDKGMAIMKNYKVNFAVDEKTIEKYKGYGIDFEKANGTNGANLPVPATYIIGKDGKIKYVFFNTDYSKRASVKDILDNL